MRAHRLTSVRPSVSLSDGRRQSSPSLRSSPGRRGPSAFAIGAAAAVLIALVGVAIGAYVLGRSSYVETDARTLCPVAEPPAEVVALILDMSDRLNEVQLLSVRNHLERLLYSELPRFAYVETYAVQDRPGVVPETEPATR